MSHPSMPPTAQSFDFTLAKVQRIVCGVAAAVLTIASFVCIYVRPDFGFTATWANILGAVLAPGLMFALAVVAFNWCTRAHQTIKIARKANQFLAVFHSPKKFILLLRAFESKLMTETTHTTRQVQRERVQIIKGLDHVAIPTGKTYTDTEIVATHIDDVRTFILQALTSHRLVVIDGKVDRFVIEDFPVLSSDSNWWQIFLRLARDAQMIFVLPEPSPSLQNEVAHLLGSEAAVKTCILMPPSRNMRDLVSRTTHWQAAQAGMRMALPGYRAQGAIFQPASDAAVQTLFDYSADAMQRLLAESEQHGRTLAEALSALQHEGLLADSFASLRRAVR